MNRWTKKEKRIIFGVTLFWILLLINTLNTNNISSKNLEYEIITLKKIEKSYGKDSSEYNVILTNIDNKEYSILPDFDECIPESLFKDKLIGKRIKIGLFNEFLRTPFMRPSYIYSLKINKTEYLNQKCVRKVALKNVYISIIFGIIIIPIFIFGIYLDRIRKENKINTSI